MIPYYESHHSQTWLKALRGNFTFRGHLHVQCEVIWVRQGTMRILYENQEHVVGAGDLFIIFPDQVHAYLGSSEDVNGYLLMFHPQEAFEMQDKLLRGRPRRPLLHTGEICAELREALEWLEKEWQVGERQAFRALLSYIIVKSYPYLDAVEEKDSSETDLIRQALQHIRADFYKEVPLTRLAKELGVSPYHLSHLFSRYLKMGYPAYVNALRVEQARRMLLTTNDPITQIAYDCGFNSQTTFNRVFRERFQMTPRQMRKKAEKN